jgi:GNAT superfamily N-acetyltransferase
MPQLNLPNGYYDLPKGKLANVVTCLEMLERPAGVDVTWPIGISLQKVDPANLISYRALFREVGEDLMWFSRLIMPDDQLNAVLSNPQIESFVLVKDSKPIGLLELNFLDMPNCELAFFGLAKAVIGTGLGSLLMADAKKRAWARPINRFWVHTCHYDHPRAVGFYKTSGFKPYALMVEIHDDPRLSGHLALDSSPHVALVQS